MVATHIKKIKHSMLFVTGMYLRDIINTIFITLHLNVSGLSVLLFFFFCFVFVLFVFNVCLKSLGPY